jgi:hypothetical protein
MSRIKEFTVGRGVTIPDGNFGSDKPSFSMTVALEDGDDLATEVSTTIETVNDILKLIAES